MKILCQICRVIVVLSLIRKITHSSGENKFLSVFQLQSEEEKNEVKQKLFFASINFEAKLLQKVFFPEKKNTRNWTNLECVQMFSVLLLPPFLIAMKIVN